VDEQSVASAVQNTKPFGPSDRLYTAIGDFMADHRLSVDPVNYAFAHRVLSDPKGPLATTVARITDGGVRLTSRDIEDIGCRVVTPGATAERGKPGLAGEPIESPNTMMQALVARTQMQVEDFADTVAAMRIETQVFGRDLLAGADAIREASGAAVEDITQLARTMLDRVQAAEERLAAATVEAEALRLELEAARDDARRDPLTGLANRRAFEDAFAAAEGSTPMCVALCDIDHFKSVNDRFGHAVGDRVLKVIAEALREACGEHLVARYGGEEFAILFSGVPVETAVATLDTARGAVAGKRYRLRETDAPLGAVTFSGGVSAYERGEVMGSVMGRADRLLYAAKGGGRNAIKSDGDISQQ
jgi:diguanylate cyclase